jgi:hypothetical protein
MDLGDDYQHRARKVKATRETLRVDLTDGRTIIVPTYWYPRLLLATAKQRSNYKLLGDGEGIRWPAVDEDLSVVGLLRGSRAPKGSEFWKSDLLTKKRMRRRRAPRK